MTAVVTRVRLVSAALGAVLVVAVTVGLELRLWTGLDTAVVSSSPPRSSVLLAGTRRVLSRADMVFPAASALLAAILAKRQRSVRPLLARG